MTLLGKDAILKAEDKSTQEVDVPEWGGKVLLRGLTGHERDAFEASTVRVSAAGGKKNVNVNYTNLRARLVAVCMVDEKGERIFKSGEDVTALGKKSGKTLDKLFKIAQDLSGISDEAVKELSEDLESAQKSDSTTG